jgi:hypothetical protein
VSELFYARIPAEESDRRDVDTDMQPHYSLLNRNAKKNKIYLKIQNNITRTQARENIKPHATKNTTEDDPTRPP